ncbi:MAG: SusD/RagB family nutrient-binding outer membrane lipoprotein [Bacteroidota bacterium]
MKKLGLYVLALLVGAISITSCDFEDTNIDPSRPTDADLRLILPQVITQTAYNQSSNNARIAGIIMQYYEGFDAQQVAYTDYVIGEDVFNSYWRLGLYAGALRSAQNIIDKTADIDAPYYEAIAKVLLAENYATAASMFGDIPMSQALQGADNLKPVYDSQEQVYQRVQELLDEAIVLFSGDAGSVVPSADDLIFGGDAAAWIATAHALKARYMSHTSMRDPDSWNKILSTIENSAFQTSAEAPYFNYGTTQNDNNPLAKFGVDRPNTLVIDNRLEANMSERMDPRRDFYMEEGDGAFLYYSANPQLIWAQNSASIPFISYTELLFLKAEAQQRTGASREDVQATLASAIQSSLDLVGASSETFAANQANLDGKSDEEIIQTIVEEAYYSYYGISFLQTWTNFRRTGYPALTPSSTGANGLNPSGVVPVRFLYPVSESQTNSENLEQAKSRQGGALLDAKLWSFGG